MWARESFSPLFTPTHLEATWSNCDAVAASLRRQIYEKTASMLEEANARDCRSILHEPHQCFSSSWCTRPCQWRPWLSSTATPMSVASEKTVSDCRLVCPHVTTSVSLYSTVFFVLYAFGFPVAMHVSLRYAGICRMVEETRQQTKVGAMLSLFIKLYLCFRRDALKLSKLKEATAGAEGMEGTSVESILKLPERYSLTSMETVRQTL